MSLSFSNLMGAVSKLTNSYGEEKSLKGFLSTIGNFGVTIKSRYEMNFSGIDDVTFFVTNISVPGVRLNTTEISFAGRKVEVPVNYEYEHDFSMTLLNDNSGFMYNAIKEFLMTAGYLFFHIPDIITKRSSISLGSMIMIRQKIHSPASMAECCGIPPRTKKAKGYTGAIRNAAEIARSSGNAEQMKRDRKS